MKFPEKFVWGTATSSYQIEGAAYLAGGGRSVWDMLCQRPGAVKDSSNGDIADDHYRLWKQDVALMANLGIQAYRFSVSWPRILPDGTGRINAAGLDFYDRLVDTLITAGIEPWLTLFHWDFPHELYCRGGWLNRDSADWMADYTQAVVERLSDRVTRWMTINEPQCFIVLGHEIGIHAPGDKLGKAEVLRAGHNALRAHGKAVQVIRAAAKKEPSIGYAPCGITSAPATDSAEDVEAARSSMFNEFGTDLFSNTWWMDPVYLGHYPAGSLAAFGSSAPDIREGDMETIAQPLDFFGCNIYSANIVKAGEDGKPVALSHPLGIGRTTSDWPVVPQCLYWGPKFFYERYGKLIYITENGLSNNDWVASDGGVHDPQRIDFVERHLRELGRSIVDGVDVAGYFLWSFMDNFEWAEGYRHRFGMVYVDYATQKRTPKDSAYRYSEIIRARALE